MHQPLTNEQQEALLTICLMAAFADGGKDDAERELIKKMAGSVLDESLDAPAIYQNVLFKRIALGSAAAPLASGPAAQLAYEMAVGVCEADDVLSDPEKEFLDNLRGHLGIAAAATQAVRASADELALAPVQSNEIPAAAGAKPDAAVEKMVMNYAILNGALELLPESLATMAIIPLQMKLVYRIGKSYGYELDQGHVRDFLATAGVGLTSQYLEQAATKLVGGLLRKVGGRMLGGLGRQATSSAMAFATTWALGQVARRYYAGGRTMDTAVLKDAFAGLLSEAKTLQAQYLPQMQDRARTLDVQQVLRSIRG